VAIGDPGVTAIVDDPEVVIHHRFAPDGALPLAAARNAGAAHALRAGAELLIFLDVDCIPAVGLVERYVAAYQQLCAPALLCGPVTYLPRGVRDHSAHALQLLQAPHPARPAPAPGELVTSTDHDLFWSLSFAVSAPTWRRIGGFCPDYVGYGGEDTDFAAVAADHGIPLVWVGGADAYHQYHPVSDPPAEHLDDIIDNARVFRRRWGRWPMMGWLMAFQRAGLLELTDDEIVPACEPGNRDNRTPGRGSSF